MKKTLIAAVALSICLAGCGKVNKSADSTAMVSREERVTTDDETTFEEDRADEIVTDDEDSSEDIEEEPTDEEDEVIEEPVVIEPRTKRCAEFIRKRKFAITLGIYNIDAPEDAEKLGYIITQISPDRGGFDYSFGDEHEDMYCLNGKAYSWDYEGEPELIGDDPYANGNNTDELIRRVLIKDPDEMEFMGEEQSEDGMIREIYAYDDEDGSGELVYVYDPASGIAPDRIESGELKYVFLEFRRDIEMAYIPPEVVDFADGVSADKE